MRVIKIAYVSESAPDDRHAWSGTVHYIFRALQQAGFQVVAAGPARPGFWRLALGVLNKVSLVLFKKRIDYRHSIIYCKAFGSVFRRRLNKIQHDLVVVCGSTECGAYLQSTKPVVYVLDRTIGGAIGYHKILSNLWHWSENQSVYTDKKAMVESSLLLFSSSWAAGHARDIYGIPPGKISVLPFGANLDNLPEKNKLRYSHSGGTWKMLLVGTYWINKGADIALNALRILLARGIPAELTVVGCEPPPGTSHPQLHMIPFIDKNNSDGQRKMSELFHSHDVFILPTRFDCTPIVFCEASAYALPVLSADTGGVGGHVKQGVNGYLIPYDDLGIGYADKIEGWSQNPVLYEKLRISSRQQFENELNWDQWAKKFREAIEPLVTQQ